ncbi:MAG: hypothetical protein AB7S26_20875 [Sandaracinaceae bacterium]
MGIEKPYEAELGTLGEAPGPPTAPDIERCLAALIQPDDDAVRVAGHPLRVAGGVQPELAAARVRDLLSHRLRERRPHADATTFERLRVIVDHTVADEDVLDRRLKRALVHVVDGL